MKHIDLEEADPRASNLFYPGGYTAHGLCTDRLSACDNTRSIKVEGAVLCVYCARLAYPIHDFVEVNRYGSFHIIGYACACKGACDEREMNQKLRDLEFGYHTTRNSILNGGPAPDVELLRAAKISLIQGKRLAHNFLDDIGTELKFYD